MSFTVQQINTSMLLWSLSEIQYTKPAVLISSSQKDKIEQIICFIAGDIYAANSAERVQ